MINRLVSGVIFLVSRFFRALSPAACRFHPSCSSYSMEAFRSFHFFRACRLTALRLLKCHPWHPGGHDPLWKNEQ